MSIASDPIVLVVDENIAHAELAARVLELSGLSACAAITLTEGRTAVFRLNPEVVLVGIAEHNARTCLDFIQEIANTKGRARAVIAMTTLADDETLQTLLHAGVRRVLTLPFRLSLLVKEVSEAQQGR